MAQPRVGTDCIDWQDIFVITRISREKPWLWSRKGFFFLLRTWNLPDQTGLAQGGVPRRRTVLALTSSCTLSVGGLWVQMDVSSSGRDFGWPDGSEPCTHVTWTSPSSAKECPDLPCTDCLRAQRASALCFYTSLAIKQLVIPVGYMQHHPSRGNTNKYIRKTRGVIGASVCLMPTAEETTCSFALLPPCQGSNKATKELREMGFNYNQIHQTHDTYWFVTLTRGCFHKVIADACSRCLQVKSRSVSLNSLCITDLTRGLDTLKGSAIICSAGFAFTFLAYSCQQYFSKHITGGSRDWQWGIQLKWSRCLLNSEHTEHRSSE